MIDFSGSAERITESTLVIGLVLPDVMGTYGDGGNALVLRERARMRGISAEVLPITLDDPVPATCDVYTLGGAEDYAQRLATRHLARYPGLQQAAGRGAPVLAVCAAIQILGHWYETSEGERVEGVSLFDLTTTPLPKRCIGELAAWPLLDALVAPLTGFENHRGGTILGPDAKGLSRVMRGAGNGFIPPHYPYSIDGVVQGNAIGTYMHGPALARNPELADHLIARATGQKRLAPLDLDTVDQLRNERIHGASA